MRIDWHFLGSEKGWSPNQAPGIDSLCDSSGRPSCDATSLKLRVIDFISQHDEGSDQQPPADGHFRFGVAAANQDSLVNSSQFRDLCARLSVRLRPAGIATAAN